MTREKERKRTLRLLLTGFAMGSADIVPGVSGGTIAFIAGIYEELIHSIKKASSDSLLMVLKGKVVESIKAIPFDFLIPLGLGIMLAVFSLANILSYALVEYPIFLWSFFFGLIVASIMVVRKRIENWSSPLVLIALASAGISYAIVGAVPVETPASLPAFFISGMIAISAMILPGISGSFLLLIMGKYQQILEAVTDLNIVVLVTFMAGAAIGLAVFARVLSYLFKHYHDLMIALLTGLMIGSLRKVWPWKETVRSFTDRHGDIIPLVQKNMLPETYNSDIIVAVVLAAVGALVILQIEKLGYSKESGER